MEKDRLTTNPEDQWNLALIGHLVRLGDGGRFQSEERCGKGQAYGRVSDRMKRGRPQHQAGRGEPEADEGGPEELDRASRRDSHGCRHG